MRWNCTQGPDARSSHRNTPRDPSIRRWTPGKRSDGVHLAIAISLAVLCIGSGFPLDVSYTYDDLYHCTFLKTLTNLTDLGPGDGGTTVIAGTHKISPEVSQEEIVGAAIRDPRMIHHVEAPAGSVLLFFESLIHASGIIESDRDRVLILGGYTPPMFQAWSGYEADPAFAATVSEGDRSLLTGGAKYGWQRHTRELGKAAQTAGEVQ